MTDDCTGRETPPGPVPFVEELPHEPHPVLDLRVVAVVRSGRDGQAGPEKEFVGKEDPPRPAAPKVGVADAARLRAYLRGDRRGHGRERGAAAAEAGEPHRHHGHGEELRAEREQVAQGRAEQAAVVPARADHDLGVEGDALAGQAPQHVHDGTRPRIAEHGAPAGRVGHVDGHEEGRQAEPHDPVELAGRGVREGDVIAVYKRVAEVLILDVKPLPQARRHLVDEAEDAFVGAATDGRGPEFGREGEVRFSPHREVALPAAPPKGEAKGRGCGEETQVELVGDRFAVDRRDMVARPHPRPGERRRRTKAADRDSRTCLHGSFPARYPLGGDGKTAKKRGGIATMPPP